VCTPLTSVPHTPRYLDRLPPYVKRDGIEVAEQDGLVYDVKGEGSYITRRSRYSHWTWAPFVRLGRVSVTRYTVAPEENELWAEHFDYGEGVKVYSSVQGYRVVGPCARVGDRNGVLVNTNKLVEAGDLMASMCIGGVEGIVDVQPVTVHPYPTSYHVQFEDEQYQKLFRAMGGMDFETFWIRAIPWALTVDQGLYASSIVTSSSYLELDDESNEWPVPGLPRGRLRDCFIVDMPQLPMICMPRVNKFLAIVFPDVRDMDFFAPQLSRDLSLWARFGGGHFPLGDMKSVQPTSPLVNDVAAAISDRVVSSWYEQGMTISQIQAKCPERSITNAKLRVIFRTRSTTVCWFSDNCSLDRLEWIHLENIRIHYAGTRTHNSVEGRGVQELYSTSQNRRKGVWSYSGHMVAVAPFIRLLLNNNFRVRVQRLPLGVELHYSYMGAIR